MLVSIYRYKHDPEGVVWLDWFAIDTKYRGSGAAQQMIEWDTQKARKLKSTLFCLQTWNDGPSQAALKFYRRSGFEEYAPEEQTTDHLNAVYMQKQI